MCTYDQTNGLPPHHCEVSSVFIIIMVFTVKFYKLKGIRYVNLMGIRSIAHKPENVLTILTLALFFLVSTPRSVLFFLGLEGEPAKSKTRI